jgi:hypothetical protein
MSLTLRRNWWLLVGVLLLVGGPREVRAAELDAEEQAFVTLINTYRQQNGCGTLAISAALDRAAVWMSTDMGQKRYFSHTDSLGRAFRTRLTAFGYPTNTYSGENIAAGNATASATFQQWKNSPGHNANMLNANYRAMGIARVYTAGSPYSWYWTNDFGGILESSPTPTLPPTTNVPPTVSITSPLAGTTLTGTALVRVTAADDRGVARVTIQVDTGAISTDTLAPYEFTCSTLALSDGLHTLTAMVYDADGLSATQRVSVTVRNASTGTLPKVPVTVRVTPQAGGALVTWLPGTGGGPVTAYEVQTLLSTGTQQYTTYKVLAPTTRVTITAASTGYHLLRVRALNAAGASSYTWWTRAYLTAPL